MHIEIPDFCLVTLIGPSGSGKSHLASRLFNNGECLSSDFFRTLVSGNENNQQASTDAFDCLYHVAQKRLDRRLLTVVDATNLQKWARKKALEFAKDNNCFCIALVLNMAEPECQKNNASRPGRHTAADAVRRQCDELRWTLKTIKKEGFRQVFIINSLEEANSLEISRKPLWTDKRFLHGPFDIIGDVHGCYQELCELLRKLGYLVRENEFCATAPHGRTAIFLGDLCDRGPQNLAVLRLVMNMVNKGQALCVPGNHDEKLSRWLDGEKVQMSNGLDLTVAELEQEEPVFRKELKFFLGRLVSHYMLDDGKLLVCHAGLPERLHGRSSRYVRDFCLFGDPTGKFDEFGLPERNDWAADYAGHALVAYGHCPDPDTRIINNTVCLDAGCVFGGRLAALRWPEKEITSVAAAREYSHSPKPLQKLQSSTLPDAEKLLKRQRMETGLGLVVIRDEERAHAALETSGRFAADPRWLIYLPPTMSPCESSALADYLEHPAEALAWYDKHGIKNLICQEKHMGSRGIVIVCRDDGIAERRFGVAGKSKGIILSRTGRPFFSGLQSEIQNKLLESIRSTLTDSGFWNDHKTDWLCLDCEIMPWSFKARKLVESQYAPYGMAAKHGLAASCSALDSFKNRLAEERLSVSEEEMNEIMSLGDRLSGQKEQIDNYNRVWKSFCHAVRKPEDIRIAPFHVLATEDRVWHDVTHDRQLAIIEKYLSGLPGFTPTRNIIVNAEEDADKAVQFWQGLQAEGAEGMVVKPLDFIPRSGQKILQPALKCRGREYLRIIYGPAYTENMDSLKKRSLAAKRNRALKEFALGIDALERFVNHEPIHKIHECVFSILALESEPQDMRL